MIETELFSLLPIAAASMIAGSIVGIAGCLLVGKMLATLRVRMARNSSHTEGEQHATQE